MKAEAEQEGKTASQYYQYAVIEAKRFNYGPCETKRLKSVDNKLGTIT